jgi:hypothetical protein
MSDLQRDCSVTLIMLFDSPFLKSIITYQRLKTNLPFPVNPMCHLVFLCSCPSLSRIISFILIVITTSPVFAQMPIVRELAPGVFCYFGDDAQQKSANCTWVVSFPLVYLQQVHYKKASFRSCLL